jgi:hypothetical protein
VALPYLLQHHFQFGYSVELEQRYQRLLPDATSLCVYVHMYYYCMWSTVRGVGVCSYVCSYVPIRSSLDTRHRMQLKYTLNNISRCARGQRSFRRVVPHALQELNQVRPTRPTQ